MNKRKLVIIEGAIASGKSSLAHLLRENMKHTTMLSLSSIYNDSSVSSFLYHTNILNMAMDITDSNFILCRSFLSNEIYARLGHKDYDNSENYQFLLDKLKFLARYYYDVKIIIVGTGKKDFEQRLSKRNKFELVNHTVEEALLQQREYLKMADELRSYGLDAMVVNNTGLTKEQLCRYVMENI